MFFGFVNKQDNAQRKKLGIPYTWNSRVELPASINRVQPIESGISLVRHVVCWGSTTGPDCLVGSCTVYRCPARCTGTDPVVLGRVQPDPSIAPQRVASTSRSTANKSRAKRSRQWSNAHKLRVSTVASRSPLKLEKLAFLSHLGRGRPVTRTRIRGAYVKCVVAEVRDPWPMDHTYQIPFAREEPGIPLGKSNARMRPHEQSSCLSAHAI